MFLFSYEQTGGGRASSRGNEEVGPVFRTTVRGKGQITLPDEVRRERARFAAVLRRFIQDAEHGRLRPGLRVKGLRSAPGVFEMTWAPDGRATFEIGATRGEGLHVVWRRTGDHSVLERS
jgi:hypothetical protein